MAPGENKKNVEKKSSFWVHSELFARPPMMPHILFIFQTINLKCYMTWSSPSSLELFLLTTLSWMNNHFGNGILKTCIVHKCGSNNDLEIVCVISITA